MKALRVIGLVLLVLGDLAALFMILLTDYFFKFLDLFK